MNAAPAVSRSARGTAPRSVTGVMWKTVSGDCNLACDYCYYTSCGIDTAHRTIDDALLAQTIRRYMEQSRGSIGFAWQGGEPLLAGLPFFEKVVALQAHYAPPNTAIGNAVQTNGTLLDDAWARFFRQYSFLVGVSVDGPQAIHDAHRRTATGKGTFDLVRRKIAHLERRGVDFNILTVLHQDNVGRARELMAFYEREGWGYVQFIPGMDFRAQSPEAPPRYLITPQQYAAFLREAFDVWYNGGAPRMSVRFFDNVLSVYAGREAESCKQRERCSATLVLERNGDAYPCDFYMSAAWRLGNVGEHALAELFAHPAYLRFAALKGALPAACRACPHLSLCHGGCPRDRTWNADGTVAGPAYFCEAYREFYDYAHERFTRLAAKVRARAVIEHAQSGRPWPERNDACVCGSGRKFKRCCAPIRDGLLSGR